ncbi:hypothetical protein PI23P_08645 [Polaribacter irgensii 23-P]|uniref:Uncharacterized protein n=1 Tax=Polaribacter irgensii 23-P TaxID=313594 RepID=A4BZT8_9FLAO|nr:Stealth CR1 domain-containing protein [Polaribacter irgensii]EAR12681.1 hypothetical protein PI23P_08645 [Polaribacter irgensii 23-P]
MQTDEDFVVDAVITWVDGNDQKHKQKMAGFLENSSFLDTKSIGMRYDQVNEIEFSVKSILKYAKFVRNIYIVTDNQTPDFLKDIEKAKIEYPTVFIVDHRTIFSGYHQYLPTFNSLSIESLLYKIPNLSEHFLYFNDDFFILNKTTATDFFIKRVPIIRGRWKLFHEDIWHKKLKAFFQDFLGKKKNSYSHNQGLQKSAKFLKMEKYILPKHTPSSLRKSTLSNYFEKHSNVLEKNIKYRFRHPSQFVCHSLSNHLEIKKNTFIFKKDCQLIYLQNYKKPFFWIKLKLNYMAKDQNKLFLCMQSLNQSSEKKLQYIKSWLYNKYQ